MLKTTGTALLSIVWLVSLPANAAAMSNETAVSLCYKELQTELATSEERPKLSLKKVKGSSRRKTVVVKVRGENARGRATCFVSPVGIELDLSKLVTRFAQANDNNDADSAE